MVRLDVEIQSDSRMQVSVDLRLTDDLGRAVGYGSLGNLNEKELVELGKGTSWLTFGFPIRQLAEGKYYMSIDLSKPDVEYYDRADHCLSFEIVRTPPEGTRRVLSQSWGYGSYEIPLERF